MSWSIRCCLLIFASLAAAQDGGPDFQVADPACILFGPQYNHFVNKALPLNGLSAHRGAVGALTRQVAAELAYVPPGSRTYTFDQPAQPGTIDFYIFGALQSAGVTPAPP